MREIEKLSKRILAEGGATTPDPHPLERYRVSVRPDLERSHSMKGWGWLSWQETGQAIFEYLRDLPSGTLDTPGSYFGAWIEDGQLVLDVSRAYTSLETAKLVGKRNSQKAIYDAVADEVIYL